ncbi:helix-turn-helix domain-containing protein [Streptomyces sp. NPDC059783]|uniref:helix-turn-helix domain-containing protein n=1 Tax=Streptomyces sp. NPDC059783 TaxID=3346944 RepID=UPI003669278D
MTFRSLPLSPFASARHYFGSELRRHRERANLSLVQLADIVSSSKSTLARIETAELMPPPDMPSCLDAAFGTDRHFTGLYGLAKQEIHPDQYRRYMNFEAEAVLIEQYGAQALPGLLQTEAYAREFLRCQRDLSEEQMEERVTARMSRQERLNSDSAPFRWAIIDEAALRRQMGCPAAMHQQLASLLAQADTPNSSIQVMPFSAGLHYLMGSALTLLTLADGTKVAYEEGIEAGHLYEDGAKVAQWQRHYEVQRANALSLRESAQMIRTIMEGYEPCDTTPS